MDSAHRAPAGHHARRELPGGAEYADPGQRRLDLVLTEEDRSRLVDVPAGEVPQSFRDEFGPQLALWQRDEDVPAERTLAGFEYRTPAAEPVPLVGPGGQLVHRDDVLLVVVPEVQATFSDSFLISSASGMELLFTGVDATQQRLESHGLAREIKVKYAAESGVLAAQYARYEAWLSVVSMVRLAVALVVAAALSAYLVALLQARNDFARRLVGQAWLWILRQRVALDVALAALLTVAVAALQPPAQVMPVAVTAAVVVAVSPVVHVLAARQGFSDVRARRL